MDELLLSKRLSFILRHQPQLVGLTLDKHGFVSINELVNGMNRINKEQITVDDVLSAVNNCPKQRFEVEAGKIRAIYGHSVAGIIKKKTKKPLTVLYHGTIKDSILKIKQNGLLSMSRQYVHLSEDKETANQVAVRKGDNVAILIIKTNEAYKDGFKFFSEKNGIWLSDNIPTKYIEFPTE